MFHLGYPLHNIPVLSVVRHVPDFSFTFLAVLLIAWPHTLPLHLSLLFSTFSLSPALFPLQDALASFLFIPSSFITNTPCICAPFLHTYNTALSIPLALPLAFSTLPHTSLLYLLKFQIYFGKSVSPFFLFSFCSIGLSVRTSYISNTHSLTFLLTLPLVKQGHAFL